MKRLKERLISALIVMGAVATTFAIVHFIDELNEQAKGADDANYTFSYEAGPRLFDTLDVPGMGIIEHQGHPKAGSHWKYFLPDNVWLTDQESDILDAVKKHMDPITYGLVFEGRATKMPDEDRFYEYRPNSDKVNKRSPVWRYDVRDYAKEHGRKYLAYQYDWTNVKIPSILLPEFHDEFKSIVVKRFYRHWIKMHWKDKCNNIVRAPQIERRKRYLKPAYESEDRFELTEEEKLAIFKKSKVWFQTNGWEIGETVADPPSNY